MPRSYNPYKIDTFAPGRHTDRGTNNRVGMTQHKGTSKRRLPRNPTKVVLSAKKVDERKLKTFLKGSKPHEKIVVTELLNYLKTPRNLTIREAADAVFVLRLAPNGIKIPFENVQYKQASSRPLSAYFVSQLLQKLIDAEIVKRKS